MNNNPKNRQNRPLARRTPVMRNTTVQNALKEAPERMRPEPNRMIPDTAALSVHRGNPHGRGPKRISLFYILYFSGILVALVGLIIGTVFLRSFLTEYESAQPVHMAETVFKTYFENIRYKELNGYFNSDAFMTKYGYESKDALYSAMDACIAGLETSFHKTGTADDGSVEYAVNADKLKIATIKLSYSGKTTKRGYNLYQLDSITVYDILAYNKNQSGETEPVLLEYTFTAPQSYKIAVNGTELTQSQQVNSYNDTTILKHMPESYAGIPYSVYKLSLEEAPETVTATDSNGDPAEPSFDEATRAYSFEFVYDKALSYAYSEYAITVAQALAVYMQAGSQFSAIAKYYDPNEPLYETTRAAGADSWMVNKYDSVEFKNVICNEFYKYDEDSFACRVAMVQIGHRAGYDDSTDPIDYTFFFHLVNGEYLLYLCYNN